MNKNWVQNGGAAKMVGCCNRWFPQISVKPPVKPPKMHDLSCCSSKRQGLPNVHDSKKAGKNSSPDNMFNGKVPVLVRKNTDTAGGSGTRFSGIPASD